jgi:hypothetical protein
VHFASVHARDFSERERLTAGTEDSHLPARPGVKGLSWWRRTHEWDLAPGQPHYLGVREELVPDFGAIVRASSIGSGRSVDLDGVETSGQELRPKRRFSHHENEPRRKTLGESGEKLRARHSAVHTRNFHEKYVERRGLRKTNRRENERKPEPGGVEGAQSFEAMDPDSFVFARGESYRARRSDERKAQIGSDDRNPGELLYQPQTLRPRPAEQQYRAVAR